MKNLITLIVLLISVSASAQICTGIVNPNTLSKTNVDCNTFIDTYNNKTYTFASGTTWTETASVGIVAEVDGSTTNELPTYTASSGAPSSPKAGDLWLRTGDNALLFRVNNAWRSILTGGANGGIITNLVSITTDNVNFDDNNSDGENYFAIEDATTGVLEIKHTLNTDKFTFNSVAVDEDDVLRVKDLTGLLLKDTLVIPIYCQGWNDAVVTGSDYRGWRVPETLNNARIIRIQYSADDINGGTVLVQTTNGVTNYGSATIPTAGFVSSSVISQTILTGQLIRPDVNTVTGSPSGLMMNLIIEKN